MQKAVLRVEWGNEKERKRAMKIVSAYEGIQSVAVDMDTKKVTVIGNMDPVQLAEHLRKRFGTVIEYVGPKETPKPTTEEPNTDTNVNSPDSLCSDHVAYPYNQPYPYPYPYPSPSSYYPPPWYY
ncbi:hypothetical protein ACJRO7_002716 [Eucalyptus globulus]|uniref:HMA domain-containing protein n=1 Tax=Eucalyptus globulus TaxID=34317 RepID=A0ABD3LYM7_EUCGL